MSLTNDNLPLHVAITMDGNGRWAQQKNLPRTAGHDQGLKTVKRIVKKASDLGIKYLTLYIFSTENWKRAEQEVGFLMNLIHVHLCAELDFYRKNKIKLNHIGKLEALPKNIQKDITEAIEDTIAELIKLIKKLTGANANNIIVTADHGFIYKRDKIIYQCKFSRTEA